MILTIRPNMMDAIVYCLVTFFLCSLDTIIQAALSSWAQGLFLT